MACTFALFRDPALTKARFRRGIAKMEQRKYIGATIGSSSPRILEAFCSPCLSIPRPLNRLSNTDLQDVLTVDNTVQEAKDAIVRMLNDRSSAPSADGSELHEWGEVEMLVRR